MIINEKTNVREINNEDKTQLANLIHFGTYVHRHLDWRPPLDWIGHQPFLCIETHGRILAAIACAPDPPEVAWIRLFVSSSQITQARAWEQLWPQTREYLLDQNVSVLAAIPLQKWIRELLENNGFENTNNIITLAWDNPTGETRPQPKDTFIRRMKTADLEEVANLDSKAFHPLWRNSATLLELARNQSVYATVATDNNKIVGYQISTPTQYGVHLGRLAVKPNQQGKGIGYALVYDLQSHFQNSADCYISVNTQDNNKASIALYKKAGFHQTAETFPVYQYNL